MVCLAAMSTTPSRRSVGTLVVVGALLLQALIVYAPQAPGPEPAVPGADKVVHAVVFALPVVLAGVARLPWWRWLVVALALHAPVSELVQHTVLPHRSGDPLDVLADLVGLGGAVLWVEWWVRRPRRRHPRSSH